MTIMTCFRVGSPERTPLFNLEKPGALLNAI